VLARLAAQFGGVDRLAKFWASALRKAHRQSRSHGLIVRSFLFFMQATRGVIDQRAELHRTEAAEMSPEQRRAAYRQLEIESIRREPAFAVAVLEELGYQVTPPDTDGDRPAEHEEPPPEPSAIIELPTLQTSDVPFPQGY
jgi:hypothetical protein